MTANLTSNAAAFKALFAEFLAKARPFITDSAASPHFDAVDAHECLDQMSAFADTIHDHITGADEAEAEAAQERDYERYGSDAYQHGTHRLFVGERL